MNFNFEKIVNNVILESVSDIVYHFTTLDALQDICKTKNGKFKMSKTSSDYDMKINGKYGKKAIYFMSLTRQKSSEIGFSALMKDELNVRFTLDGRKLNQNLKGGPVDFYGLNADEIASGKKTHKDRMTIGHYSANRIDRTATIQTEIESEDRIFSNKEYIDNFNNYVLRVDINSGLYTDEIIPYKESLKNDPEKKEREITVFKNIFDTFGDKVHIYCTDDFDKRKNDLKNLFI